MTYIYTVKKRKTVSNLTLSIGVGNHRIDIYTRTGYPADNEINYINGLVYRTIACRVNRMYAKETGYPAMNELICLRD